MWRLMNRWWVCIPLHLLYFYTIFCQSHTGTRESCIITHFSLFFPHAQVLTFQRGLFWTAHYLPIFLCTLNHYVERTDLTWEMGRKRAVKDRFCLEDIRKPIFLFVHLLSVNQRIHLPLTSSPCWQRDSLSVLRQDEDGWHCVLPRRPPPSLLVLYCPLSSSIVLHCLPPSSPFSDVLPCFPPSLSVPHCPRQSYIVTWGPLAAVVSGHGARRPC